MKPLTGGMHMITGHTAGRLRATVVVAFVAMLVAVGVLSAHDFWLVPNALAFAPGSQLEVLGQSGTKFPASDAATQPAQVGEARIIGASTDERITDLSISGKSLIIRHRPATAGQHIVAVALASRSARTTPARLQRYIALEGAPELAAQYERDGAYPKMDSVTQVSAKYAKTIVEVGSGGPRAFDKVAGHALEIVLLGDPSRLRSGDSLSVRLLHAGKPVRNGYLRAGWASPSALAADAAPGTATHSQADQVIVTGADGVAKLGISDAGLWNVRTLYAAAMPGMPEHWEVMFATIVFSVSDVGGRPGGDSADAVTAAARFHAALAAGDSTAALALLTDAVQIVESGSIEDRTHYREHHLAADIEFAKAVPSQRSVSHVAIRGDAAWIVSTSVTTGTMNGRAVNSQGAELMVLVHSQDGWKIAAVHWSSRAKRP